MEKEVLGSVTFRDVFIIGGSVVLAYLLVRFFRFLLSRYYRRLRLEDEERVTSLKFLSNIAALLIYSITAMFIVYYIPPFRTVGISLFASAGILAAILGFASQAAVSNIIGGIFIILFKPFRLGDFVKITDAYTGVVEDVTIRHTVIRSFENRRIIIPNSIVNSETIINSSIIDQSVCNFVEIGIAYDSDIDKARQIIQKLAVSHPLYYDHRTGEEIEKGEPEVRVRVIGLGDFSVNLRAYVWSENFEQGFEIKCDLLESVKKTFDQEGIEIPFPYRTVVFKKDLEEKQASNEHKKA